MYNPNTVVESRNVTFIETPPYNIRPAGDKDGNVWGDINNQASMPKQPGTPRVSPTGLTDRIRSQVLDSTNEHRSDIEETESSQVSKILGMEVSRDRKAGPMSISQGDYVRTILHRYDKENCNPSSTLGSGPCLLYTSPSPRDS